MPIEMIVQKALDYVPVEEIGFFHVFTGEGVQQQWAQDAAEPVMRGDVEAFLLTLEHRRGQLAAHQMPQYNFERGIADLQVLRKSGSKFDNAMVEKRRAN